MPQAEVVRSLSRPNNGVMIITTIPPIEAMMAKLTSLLSGPHKVSNFGMDAPTTAP